MSLRNSMSKGALRTSLAGTALAVLLAVVGLTSVVADHDPNEPHATPSFDVDADLRKTAAELEAKLAALNVPDDIASLPRRAEDLGVHQYPTPTFVEMFSDYPGAAVAAVQGRVTRVIRLRHNRAEMESDVTRVIAAKPGVDIKPGPVVLIESMRFEGPPIVLVYNPRRWPLFPGEEGIFLITLHDLRPYEDPPEDHWIPLIDRGIFRVSGDRVMSLTMGTEGTGEKMPGASYDADIEMNTVIDWGQKYQDYPLDKLIAEIVDAARAKGWVVE